MAPEQEKTGIPDWKGPLLRTVLSRAPFSGKVTTPYAPGSVHDYMHAKVTVADDTVFVGSFNLSHSGEMNAENVLELEDPQLAERLAAFIDEVRGRYPAVALPAARPAPRRSMVALAVSSARRCTRRALRDRALRLPERRRTARSSRRTTRGTNAGQHAAGREELGGS